MHVNGNTNLREDSLDHRYNMVSRRMITRSYSKKYIHNESNVYNKIIFDEKPSNIINILYRSQLEHGRMPRNALSLPDKLISLISGRTKVSSFLYLLKRLEQCSITVNIHNHADAEDILYSLNDIESHLLGCDTNVSDEYENESFNAESAQVFRQYGGVEILKRILLLSLKLNQPREDLINTNCMIKVKCKCINILKRLITLPYLGKSVVRDLLDSEYTLLQYLFSLMINKETRTQACHLVENILMHIPLFDLKKIVNLRLLLETIDDDGLSCLCRIFAVTLTDLDSHESKWALPQTKQPIKESEAELTRDANIELLLNIPGLLYRLVSLVQRKDYAERYPDTEIELEHWIRYIDEQLSEDDDLESDENSPIDPHDFLLMESHLQPALVAAAKLTNFVHVLYTLSLFLAGKHRKRVQKTLSQFKFARALNSLFDFLIWNCRCDYPQNNLIQIRAHVCPEVAVKIQFLRLLHGFCDSSEFKRQILSREEILELIKYNNETIPSLKCRENTLIVESRFLCTKEKVGLLSKIVEVVKQETFSSAFRFWLTRAIESFLRGGTTYPDQLFLINRGIVQNTIRTIITTNYSRPKEVVQSCFDMLGELIKFNIVGFTTLNTELNEHENLESFLRIINESLVDSNMFIRSIYLSIEFFIDEAVQLNFQIGEHTFLSFFDDFDRRIRYLCRMINIINVNNLTQENISCLNTTLIILMLANKKNELIRYLNAMRVKSMEQNVINQFSMSTQRKNLITNLRELIIFWHDHYTDKDKERYGLEQNSRIAFEYWKHTVELLINEEKSNEYSLNHYL